MAHVRFRHRAGCPNPDTDACGCGGSWWVTWRRGGRSGRTQSTTWPTRQQATAADALARSRHHDLTDEEVYRAILGVDETPDEGVPTVAEWAATWVAAIRRAGEIQDDTAAEYERIIARRILPRLGGLRLTPAALGEDVIADWVAWLRGQPSRRGGTIAPLTVRKAHAVLHALLAAAVPRHLPANPAAARTPGAGRRKSGLPKVEPYEPIFLRPGEIDLILRCCGPAIRPMVFVSVRTGLRLGELVVLRVQDVTLTGRRRAIHVRRALKQDGTIGSPKSRRSRRDVSISTTVADTLRPLVEGKRPGDLVFTTPRGRMWGRSNLRGQHWQRAVAAAQRCEAHPPPLPPKARTGPRRGWRVDEVSTCDCPTRLHRSPRWHDLRHTHVSLCVEEGWDPVRVQRRVGHDSIKTTMDIYGHLWEGRGDDDRLDGIERLLATAEDEDDER